MTRHSKKSSPTFTNEELLLIQSKHGDKNQLTFAVMLKFFEMHGRFPILNNLELKQLMINCATYLEFSDEHVPTTDYDWNTRSLERFKQEIRFTSGFRRATLSDKMAFIEHCKSAVFVSAPT